MENHDKLQEKGDQDGRKLPVFLPGDRVWVHGSDTDGSVKQEVQPGYFEVTTANRGRSRDIVI